jgi:polyphosphate glucokinase
VTPEYLLAEKAVRRIGPMRAVSSDMRATDDQGIKKKTKVGKVVKNSRRQSTNSRIKQVGTLETLARGLGARSFAGSGNHLALVRSSKFVANGRSDQLSTSLPRNVLVVDVGGTHVKIMASGQAEPRELQSGPTLLPKQMIRNIRAATKGWNYDVVSIGYPGPVLHNRPIAEPHNLGRGWVGFDFEAAFGHPVKLVNDAAMQALGSYNGGKLLFLGFGTGLGSAMIVEGMIESMELAHLPYKKHTYEHYVGRRGLKREGKHKWQRYVTDVVTRLIAALEPDDVVLGGGNVKYLVDLPPGCRRGENANAFVGGFRLWEGVTDHVQTSIAMQAVT